jgi:hypothetical protein
VLDAGTSIFDNSLFVPSSKFKPNPKKYDTIAQGFLLLKRKLTKILYIIYIKNRVATTETKEPKLETPFHPE